MDVSNFPESKLNFDPEKSCIPLVFVANEIFCLECQSGEGIIAFDCTSASGNLILLTAAL